MANLYKIAAFAGVGTLIAGTSLYKFRQYELRNTSWFKEACLRAGNHDGVHVLVGPPPLKIGDIERCTADQFVPSKEIDPTPLYVLKIPIQGKNGKANLLLWMNYLTSIEEARKSVSAWNVGLMEIQIGSNDSNKFIID